MPFFRGWLLRVVFVGFWCSSSAAGLACLVVVLRWLFTCCGVGWLDVFLVCLGWCLWAAGFGLRIVGCVCGCECGCIFCVVDGCWVGCGLLVWVFLVGLGVWLLLAIVLLLELCGLDVRLGVLLLF